MVFVEPPMALPGLLLRVSVNGLMKEEEDKFEMKGRLLGCERNIQTHQNRTTKESFMVHLRLENFLRLRLILCH